MSETTHSAVLHRMAHDDTLRDHLQAHEIEAIRYAAERLSPCMADTPHAPEQEREQCRARINGLACALERGHAEPECDLVPSPQEGERDELWERADELLDFLDTVPADLAFGPRQRQAARKMERLRAALRARPAQSAPATAPEREWVQAVREALNDVRSLLVGAQKQRHANTDHGAWGQIGAALVKLDRARGLVMEGAPAVAPEGDGWRAQARRAAALMEEGE